MPFHMVTGHIPSTRTTSLVAVLRIASRLRDDAI
jgi:hypothetical protein